MKLTDKQARFIDEYLVDHNAAAAAARAGFSKRTANRTGSRLLTNAVIRERIETARREQAERTRIDADRVVQALGRVAFMSDAEIVGSPYTGRDKIRSLEILAKHLGMFEADNRQKIETNPALPRKNRSLEERLGRHLTVKEVNAFRAACEPEVEAALRERWGPDYDSPIMDEIDRHAAEQEIAQLVERFGIS